jgi:hypothetical protein
MGIFNFSGFKFRMLQWMCMAALALGIFLFWNRATVKETFLVFQGSNITTPRIRLPIQTIQALKETAFLEVDVQGTTWKMASANVSSVGDLMAELSMENQSHTILSVRDAAGMEYLIVCDEERKISLSSMKHFNDHGMVIQKGIVLKK